MYLQSLDKRECCGCRACEQVCVPQAIVMEADAEGFLYPRVEADRCVGCGRCEKVCAYANPRYTETRPKVYAAYLRDIGQRTMSTSGGVFYAIARSVIADGGIVFGSVLDGNMQVAHKSASTLDELSSMRGSKYVQSDLRDSFSAVKAFLEEGRQVYFTGTPCQVAGLSAFLGKSYANLLTSDLVCHGVPSQRLFDTHIAWLEKKYKGKVVDYMFRDYKQGGVCETVKITVSQTPGRIITHRLPSYELSPYLYSFMHSLTYRPACYNCPFAGIPRQGDITLGDYWGSERFHPKMDSRHGISLVLVNTPAGNIVWEKIRPELQYEVSDAENAAAHNGNLVHPSIEPPERKGIYDRIVREGYDHVAKTIFRSPKYCTTVLKVFISMILGKRVVGYLKKYYIKYCK